MNKGFCEISIDRLVKAAWNYKLDNQALLEKLVNNIKRNGQIENIIVRELDTGFFEVVNGNHRIDALKKIGVETVYCFNLGNISESQAKRVAIETNETKFQSDIGLLEEVLMELGKDIGIKELSDTMPFDESYLLHILEREDIDIDSFFEEKEEEEEQKQKELMCPHCGKNIYEKE